MNICVVYMYVASKVCTLLGPVEPVESINQSINNLYFPSRDTEGSLIYSDDEHTLNTIKRITF